MNSKLIKAMKKLLLLITSSCLFVTAFAQRGLINKENDKAGVLTFATFNADSLSYKLANARLLLNEVLKLTSDDELRLEQNGKDNLGFEHQYFSQYYKGIRVEYSGYAVHGRNNNIETINGNFHKIVNINLVPSISEKDAMAVALIFINAQSYKWQIIEEENWNKKYYNKSYFPAGSMIVVPDQLKVGNKYVLAWKFDIYAQQPLSRDYVYVNASDGSIIGKESQIHFINANGTAATRYSGQRNIVSDAFNGGFRLREARNGVAIETYNMRTQGGNYGTAPDFADNNNDWTGTEFHNANMDDAALDAHWGTEMVYDYWNNVHARNSWNGIGGPLLSYVHTNLPSLLLIPDCDPNTPGDQPCSPFSDNDNAFWDGQRMTYGDGTTIFRPTPALDVCAHEIGHGVCTSTVNWRNSGETGAINEGFSDLWGASVEQWATTNKQTWLIGEDIIMSGNALRNMSNPNEHNQPDTKGGTFWVDPASTSDNGGVHTNNGVLNYWFYLLSQGGSGTNDLNNSFSVSGVSINNAARIAYQTERWELPQSPGVLANLTFDALRTATITAATHLFCANSKEVRAVTNAWFAVGVGAAYPGTVPTITGTEPICTSRPFTVTNPPAGSATTWSSSNINALTVNTSGTAMRVNNYNGFVTLNAIQTGTGGCSTVVSRQVWLGPPAITNWSIDGQPTSQLPVCLGGHTLTVTPTGGSPGNATWIVPPGYQYSVGINNLGINLTQQMPSSINIQANSSNSCGAGLGLTFTLIKKTSGCGSFALAVSPNPAVDNISVQMVPVPDAVSTSDAPEITEVLLFDGNQNIVRSSSLAGVKISLDVKGLKKGQYVLHVRVGADIFSSHVLIE
jgi:bacillolysin